MYTKTFMKIVIGSACWALVATAQAAGNPENGKLKFTTCTGCHSIPGYTNAYPTYHVPRLGAQNADYIVAALNEYKVGDRKHPTMHANAFSLSDQDIDDIAAYVASIKPNEEPHPIKGDVAAGQQKAEACASCHGKEGNAPTTSLFPKLAGQHEDYLVKALHDYKAGNRKNAIMSGMATPLSDKDITALAAYFASQPNGVYVVKD